MSYSIFDVDGHVGDLCATSFYTHLLNAFFKNPRWTNRKQKKRYPTLYQFFADGCTENLTAFKSELRQFLADEKDLDPGTRKLAQRLGMLAARSKEIVIISSEVPWKLPEQDR